MTRSAIALCLVSGALLLACGGPPPAASPSSGEPASSPAAAASAEAPSKDAKPEAEAKAEADKKPDADATKDAPAAAPKPKSQYMVGGHSLSDVSSLDVLAAFAKAGWAKPTQGVGGGSAGAYESANFPIEKGKAKGNVTLVRPLAKPMKGSGGVMPPAEQADRANKDTTAFVLDKDADVLITVEMTAGAKAADAKKLLDSVVAKGK